MGEAAPAATPGPPEQAMATTGAGDAVNVTAMVEGSPPPPGTLSSTLQLYAQLKNTLDTGRIVTPPHNPIT